MTSLDRQIISLALPTLATLLAEPTLILVDTALVGRLGVDPLAGLSLASTVLATIVGICVFLSYATTASTARYFGAGKPAQALRLGMDGMWLALGLGLVLGAVLMVAADTILGWFGPDSGVLSEGVSYLRASAWGLPGMLVVLAATGTVRGMLDTRTPLLVATIGALANIPLSYLLIYPGGLGTAGAGYGTALAQTGMGLVLGGVVVRSARRHGAALLPSGTGVLRSLSDAVPLIVRTLCLRGSILLTVAAATALGTTVLAAHQIVNAVWNFAAYGLDALAIAAQALVGQALGASAVRRAREVLDRCLVWGVGVGAVLGIILAASSGWIPTVFSTSPDVTRWAAAGLLVCGIGLPVAAVAYMLDGVLIGAGDTRYLAWMMLVSLLAYAPIPLVLAATDLDRLGLILLWAGYAGIFMGLRSVTLYWRTRRDEWIVLGESRR
ncbi:MATE family efflux transporter [Flaviflexus equikiangi]|uniref:MATE family efflux transporter n=1 Tax=Flaviflexus equikiangi TaxID=2758573 RepID=A0ABS2TEL9_9ACTO|nr:MATE family efflux transporter [Flaviflexus equikiangi]MBM9432197.1 MATE family efflux transporter [Flaviflexus equikiangi]